MIITKINSEKLISSIDAFVDMYGRKPYIICNEKTLNDIMVCKDNTILGCSTISGLTIANGTINLSPQVERPKSIKVGNLEYILKEEFHPSVWHGSKILVDPDLKYGEVYIG